MSWPIVCTVFESSPCDKWVEICVTGLTDICSDFIFLYVSSGSRVTFGLETLLLGLALVGFNSTTVPLQLPISKSGHKHVMWHILQKCQCSTQPITCANVNVSVIECQRVTLATGPRVNTNLRAVLRNPVVQPHRAASMALDSFIAYRPMCYQSFGKSNCKNQSVMKITFSWRA